MNHQATFYIYNPYLIISLMVIVASIYLRFYIEVGIGTVLLTPTPPKIPSDSDSKILTPQPWLSGTFLTGIK
jgi:hypothetical protein